MIQQRLEMTASWLCICLDALSDSVNMQIVLRCDAGSTLDGFVMVLKVLVYLHSDWGIHNGLQCDAGRSSECSVSVVNRPGSIAKQL